MSSDTLAIEVVSVQERTLEFWAAEIPRGIDGAFATSIGNDHPVFALMVLRDSNRGKNPLAQRLGDAPLHDPAWFSAHLGEFVESLDLVARRRLLYTVPGSEVVAKIDARGGDLRSVVNLAPAALYRLVVRDPADLAHLQPRQIFGSSAYSPVLHPPRSASWTLAGGDGPFAPVLSAIARVSENPALHVFRSFVEGPLNSRGKALGADGLEPRGMAWEAEHRVHLPNRLRELYLRREYVQMVYFDATAPGFKPGKHKMKRGPADPFVRGGRTEGGPRGVSISPPWRFGPPAPGPDGVRRVPFDQLHPDGIAWVDLDGEPLVRVSAEPLWNAQIQPSVIDPALPTADLETYLAGVAERLAADVERIGRTKTPR